MRFNYNGKWKKYELNEIIVFFKGNGFSKNDISSEGKPIILYGELYTTYKDEIIHTIISKTNNTSNSDFLSKFNDIIIPSSGEDPIDIAVARVLLKDNIILGGDLNVLRPKVNLSSAFLSYELNGKRKLDIAKKAQGKSIVHLHNSDLKTIKVFLPNFEEQTKIANLLQAIDKKINTQIKIIEGYKSLINGIIETVLLNSMGEEISLQTVLSEQKEYSPKNNDYPHVTLSKDGIYEKGERYDRDFLVKNEEKEYKVSHYNDICYNPANLKFGVITINKFGDCIFSPIYVTFKINKKYNPDFIALCICRNNFINRARKFEQGTVYERMSVSPDDLLSMTIKLPSLEMQNTIVNNVTSIKNKIMIEEKFLKALNDEKRYLLNNLFI